MDNKYTLINYLTVKVIIISKLGGVKKIAWGVKQLNQTALPAV